MGISRFLLPFCFYFGLGLSELRSQGLIFDQEGYANGVFFESERSARIPKAHSLKEYTPYVLTQKRSTCVAYATALAMTMSEAIATNTRDKDQISLMLASPHYIYQQNRDTEDRNCLTGINIESTMKYIEERGVPSVRGIEYPNYHPFTEKWICDKIPQNKGKRSQSRYRPDQILRVKNILDIKAALAQNLPIIVAIKALPSFEYAKGHLHWSTSEEELCRPGFGHAVTIISYDDEKFGGAIEIQNSWGEDWGNEGRIWISYNDLQQILFGAYAIQKYQNGTVLNSNTKPNTPSIKTMQNQKSSASDKGSDKWKRLARLSKS